MIKSNLETLETEVYALSTTTITTTTTTPIMSIPKIKDVRTFRLHGEVDRDTTGERHWQSSRIRIYPEFNQSESLFDPMPDAPFRSFSEIFVEIETDNGFTGFFGPIFESQAYFIKSHLAPYLVGRDPFATELLFDQMIRLDRHGRSGHYLAAVSSIDIALWDLKGKLMNLPIYRLLGGPTRDTVPAYASMLGYPVEPARAVPIALEYKDKGYQAQKWFFQKGPEDGATGKKANLDLAFALREALGEHYSLMFDAYMGWSVPYAVAMAKALEPVNPHWLEEPFPPEWVTEFSRIKRETRIPIATGEHIFTRWQARELLVNQAVDVLQSDPDWTGGISELVKVCALGSSFGVPVVAHGHSLLPALHVAAAQSPETVPMVEYLLRFQPEKQLFFDPVSVPENGRLRLPDKPGLGVSWNEKNILKKEVVTF